MAHHRSRSWCRLSASSVSAVASLHATACFGQAPVSIQPLQLSSSSLIAHGGNTPGRDIQDSDQATTLQTSIQFLRPTGIATASNIATLSIGENVVTLTTGGTLQNSATSVGHPEGFFDLQSRGFGWCQLSLSQACVVNVTVSGAFQGPSWQNQQTRAWCTLSPSGQGPPTITAYTEGGSQSFSAFAAAGSGYHLQAEGWIGYSTLGCCPSPASSGSMNVSATATFEPCLTVTPPPASICVCSGQSATLSIGAVGAAVADPITYKWQVLGSLGSWEDLNGPRTLPCGATVTASAPTSAQTQISATPCTGNGDIYVRCIVRNACTSVTSSLVNVVVQSPPTINQHPVDAWACYGGSAQFTVAATGGPGLRYSWWHDGREVGTDPVLSLSQVELDDFGPYECVISSGCCSTISAIADLRRSPGPAFTTVPSYAACVGFPVTLEVQAVGAESYEWRRNGSIIGGGPSYIIGPVTTDDYGFYECIATGPGECGTATALVGLSVFDTIPSITEQPESTTGCVGGSATFEVVGSATSFQWRKDDQELPGANTRMLVVQNLRAEDAGAYQCVLSDFFCGTLYTDPATLSICVADINCSGAVSVQDIFDMLSLYFSGDLRADVDASGSVSVQDLFTYLGLFFAGCP